MTLDQAKIILDLGEKNNIDDIRKAYRKKALQYHPDRYQTFSEQAWATKKFIKIKEAYELLMSGISISNASSSEEDIHFEDKDSFQKNTHAEEPGYYEQFKKNNPDTIFDRIYNSFAHNHKIVGHILYLFMLIPELVWFFNMLWFIMLSGIAEKIGIELKLGTGSTRRNRFTYLFIETITVLTFLPLPYAVALKQLKYTFYPILGIILGTYYTSLLIVFIISEWISFFLADTWRRPIKTELDLLLPHNGK